MNNLANYLKHRSNIQPGDVISFKGEGFISWIILRIDKRSHVAGIVSSPQVHDERILIMEADEGEVNVRAVSAKLAKYPGKAYWHQLRSELNEYRAEIDAFYWQQVGIHYDYESLFGNAPAILTGNAGLGMVKSDNSKYFCSELCGCALLHGIPEDILKSYLPHPDLNQLLSGVALRPGGIARLPVFLPEIPLLLP